MKYRILFAAAMAVAIAVSFIVPAQSQVIAPPATPLQTQAFPPGAPGVSATPWIQTSTGGAQANTVTQPAQPGKTNYCTGFEITGLGATAVTSVAVTLASGGTTLANYTLPVPAGVTVALTPLQVTFSPPISGLTSGQNMVLTVASFGAGNTAASVTMHGFAQ